MTSSIETAMANGWKGWDFPATRSGNDQLAPESATERRERKNRETVEKVEREMGMTGGKIIEAKALTEEEKKCIPF